MKYLPKLTLALFIAVLFCIPSSLAIFYYTQPMEDASYGLFRYSDDGEETGEGGEDWMVYTDENGIQTALDSDGWDGYLGLSYPGQTFYYSRELTEELDSPMLEIDVANRTISVFLGEELIYTDCPELDNRIGHLTLPMLEYDREESVMISLSPDYRGKTLTIAQSTPRASEKQSDSMTVWPCEVTLYCGYAYESGLIASAARTMLPSVLLFALLLLLLAAFIWNASEGLLLPRLPVFSLVVLFQMCSVLSKADFFSAYFGTSSFDPPYLFFHASVGAILLFLALCTSRLRPLFAAAATLQWASVLLHVSTGFFLEYGSLYVAVRELPQIMGFLTLSVSLAGIFYLWKRGERFFRHMAQAALFLIVGYLLFLAASALFIPDYAASVLTRIRQDALLLLPTFSLDLLWTLFLVSGLAAVFLEFTEQISERRTELAVLSTKNSLAMESYENLRLQTDEVMMIRHDTMKHYALLRTMAEKTPERITGYLDDLIGQMEQVRSVISSRNQTLNILLNGKLNAAKAKGIQTEVERCEAPEKLPLSETELCSLIVNILDNAINAATASREPYMGLDFHCRNRHFVFSCKNSVPDENTDKKKPMPGHGYGLKIIQNIINRFGDNMLSVEQSEGSYRITVIIPL